MDMQDGWDERIGLDFRLRGNDGREEKTSADYADYADFLRGYFWR